MSLNANGFALALDQLTDPTNGINKIGLDLASGTPPATQTIGWNTASGSIGSGTVVSNGTAITFNMNAGDYITGIWLYQDTQQVGLISITDVTDTNAFDYVVDSVTITMT
jgi:hypothetical protein